MGTEQDNTASGAGTIYVYTRDLSGQWSQRTYVKQSNVEFSLGDEFGSSIAISAGGDTDHDFPVHVIEIARREFYERAVEGDSDGTTLTDAFTGLYARVLRNAYTEEYRASAAPVVEGLQQVIGSDVVAASARQR